MFDMRLLFTSFKDRIIEIKNTFSIDILKEEHEIIILKIAKSNLQRIIFWAVSACLQEIIIIIFNITKGENNEYGTWLRNSAVSVFIFNLFMIFFVIYIKIFKYQNHRYILLLNRFYWMVFSLLMVNFVMMDILSEDTYVNYFLLLIMLSIYALLSFKEWLLITGTTAGIIITLILILHLDIINIYYITMLFIGAGFLSRALYTSHVKAILSGYNLEKDNKLLHEQCLTDSLTGLLNRRGFCIKSKELWEHCKYFNRHISVIFIDVDLFKYYNDYYGHQRGDECLIQISRCIDKFAKKGNNVLSRYGGEEFLLLIDGISKIEAITLARLIKDGIEDLKILSPSSPVSEYLTVSIGLSVAIPSDGITMDELLQQTDKNLYTAKNNGRNMVIHNIT